MCGISGFIDFTRRSSLEILKEQTDTLDHRGPDGSGYLFLETEQAQIGLGHRRLSIIDLSEGGHQPMKYHHYVITFNGEIYNFNEIKDILIQEGHTFETSSDTEVILHAFSEWGTSCVHKFIGMFAFCIYNSKLNKIWLFRDRAGVKPLFYYWSNDLFLFASELKAFHKHPNFNKEINLNSASSFMQFGYIPTPHCIFSNCSKLPMGNYLELNIVTKSINLNQYWNVYDYYNKPKLKIDFTEAKLETERILNKACQYRMVSDVPVGVFLSGGYDSTAVTALLQKDKSQKLKTFTIGVGDHQLNEAPYAKNIANYLGTDHNEIYCTEQDALSIITTIPDFYDEPFGDQSSIPTTLVSKFAKEQVTVALSADGGDEVFAGYNRYDFEVKLGWLKNLPPNMRRISASLMDKIPANRIPFLSQDPLFHHRYDKLKSLLKDYSSKNLMANLTTQFTKEQVGSLFNGNVFVLDTYFDNKLGEDFVDGISQMMATDYQTYLLDDILQKVDRATMSVSLEGREPLIDHNVIEWAASLPTNFKYNNGIKKFILKEIVHQFVPKSLLDRPKMGFAIPLANWLRNDLRDLVEDHINETCINECKFLNWKSISYYKTNFYFGKDEYTLKIWYILMFMMWFKKWGK